MKKIMSLMLGLTIALGGISLFAQDTAATGSTATTGKKTHKAKKAKKAKKDTAAPAADTTPAK